MRKNIFDTLAFTFAELMIVVTIIAIVTIAGFSSLSKLASSGESDEVTSRITTTLADLEADISASRIASYRLIFEKNAPGYIVSVNNTTANVAIDWQTGSGKLLLPAGTGVRTISFVSDEKITSTVVFSGWVTEVPFILPRASISEFRIGIHSLEKSEGYISINAFNYFGFYRDGAVWNISRIPSSNRVIIGNTLKKRYVQDENAGAIPAGSEIEFASRGKSAIFVTP